jgi:hypothetical protein
VATNTISSKSYNWYFFIIFFSLSSFRWSVKIAGNFLRKCWTLKYIRLWKSF